jgi:hypothetical protein
MRVDVLVRSSGKCGYGSFRNMRSPNVVNTITTREKMVAFEIHGIAIGQAA